MKRICQNPHCKKEFEAKAADVKRGWARCLLESAQAIARIKGWKFDK